MNDEIFATIIQHWYQVCS